MIVKKRSFLISTILTPAIMAAFVFLPVLLTRVGRGEKTIHIADYSGIVATSLIRTAVRSAPSLQLKAIPTKGTNPGEMVPRYNQELITKKVDGFLLIHPDVLASRKIHYYAQNISDFETNRYLVETTRAIITRHILEKQKIDAEIVLDATRNIHLETFKVKRKGASPSSSGLDYTLSIFMLTILFTIIMAYGQLIMRGVLEEKNNRVVEVLISSTRATTIFYGKIIGIGLAGLTQVALWIAIGGLFIAQSSIPVSQSVHAFLSPALAAYFVLFFIIGYFMYSILFSIVGATVNTDQEAQQFAAPISYLLIIPFLLGIMVTQNPDSFPVVIASLIPFFTPTLMFMRISVAMPSTFQILMSICLSLVTTLFLAWLGAKIFRTGLLMYGKKPSIREIMRWARHQ